MKTRQGFVTNSSSSSFIIAKKKGITLEEVRDAVAPAVDDFKDLCKSLHGEGLDEMFEMELGKADAGKQVADMVAEKIFGMSASLTLDDWEVTGMETSNDTEDIVTIAMYECGSSIGNDKVEVSEFGW